ncbi:MAG: sigma 54-interacting transcriptional regulator [Thiohalocapsa sp.]|nr:sigma 54-interacting transcriptional regulator [Thiohalocapsa sp.]MCF7991985.1 sigma 54-interacting transcriptional regulator [Thiohalocapsa sp.]
MHESGEARFVDLLTAMAASFVNVEPDALDDRIEEALRDIVLFLGIDRSTVGSFDDAHGQLMPTHSWAVDGVSPLPSPLPASDFPYIDRLIQAGKEAILERVDHLPPEASLDLASLRRVGLQSVAAFPLTAEGRTVGWLSFGAVRAERAWPPALVRRLRLIADVFANALLRRQKDRELRHALSENMRLRSRLESENAVWREEVLHCRDLEEVVGDSVMLQQVMRQVEQVARTDSTVLLLGETGTGKDLIATTVHRMSGRAERPLVRVNCAALPGTLMESELFGHEKGAFTGALARRPGRFELADRGTIVLDEIGELPLELQSKLLRVLQSGEFERLGASQTRKTDARVIAATNRDLSAMVREGTFRADLFYRIGVFPITVPPLRERRDDIALLVAYFVDKLRPKLGRKVMRVSDAALARLVAYDWPGNVRELENIIERSMICSSGSELEVVGIPRHPQGEGCPRIATFASGEAALRTLAEVEREYIAMVCERCGWRINGKGNAADILGLNPSTLRSRMKKLDIARPDHALSASGVVRT